MTGAALIVAILLGYAGWALLALTQLAHWESVGLLAGRRAPRTRWMRSLAAVCAGASATLCVLMDGWSFGLLLWMGIVCTTALATTLTLTCIRPAEKSRSAATRSSRSAKRT